MHSIFTIFLFIHIISGSIGLISGSLNILLKKGGKTHRRIGNVFYGGMILSSTSSLILSYLHLNPFLWMVGIFTLYMVATGKRYIYLKLLGINQEPKLLDWCLSIGMLIAGTVLLVMGLHHLIKSNSFGLVFSVFGMLGILFSYADLQNFRGKTKTKKYWLLAHISRMTGAYIASLTAFLVVNVQHFPMEVPAILVWLMPTILLVPFIFRWSRKVQ